MFIRGQPLLAGGVYFTFSFPNAVFIGGWHLKEEIWCIKVMLVNVALNNRNFLFGHLIIKI